MNKKKRYIILSILLLFICVLLFAPITFGIKRQISISIPVMRVAVQVSDLKNWPHWDNALKDSGGVPIKMSPATNVVGAWLQTNDRRLDVTQYTPSFVVVQETKGSSTVYHEVFVKADSNVNKTIVVWIDNFSLLTWLREEIFPVHHTEENLQHLKNYLEDPKQYYGFDIHVGKVIDTLLLSKLDVCLKTQRNQLMASLYQQIFDYAKACNITLPANTPRMANFVELGKDSLKILVGVPVNKKVPSAKGVTFLEMPTLGKAAIAHYSGDYKGIKKLYTAMSQYMFDNHLQQVAAPYERYLTDPRTSQDSLQMKIDLYCPLFY
jgi:effector-binding domain-containing protein